MSRSNVLVAIREITTIFLVASSLRPRRAYGPAGACSYRMIFSFYAMRSALCDIDLDFDSLINQNGNNLLLVYSTVGMRE